MPIEVIFCRANSPNPKIFHLIYNNNIQKKQRAVNSVSCVIFA